MLSRLRTTVAALFAAAALTVSALPMQVLNHPLDGEPYAVDLADGLVMTFDDDVLTVGSHEYAPIFELEEVSHITYGQAPLVTGVGSPHEAQPAIALAADGVEVKMEGRHVLTVVDAAGHVVARHSFCDAVALGREALPAGVVLIFAVDGRGSIKMVLR